MKITVTASFKDNSSAVKAAVAKKASNGLSNMANDLMRTSISRTPMKSGALRRNRSKRALPDRVEVRWLVGYAAVQEAGKRRGARRFTHYTTPGTGAQFVHNALKPIRANYKRYFA